MFTSFFAGLLPIFPFIAAIIVGGEFGEKTSVFLYKQYYPVVIIIGSLAIVLGLVAMYFGKLEGLSVKKVAAKESVDGTDKSAEEEQNELSDKEEPSDGEKQ